MRRAGRLWIAAGMACAFLAACGRSTPPVEPRSSLEAVLAPDSAGLGDPVLLRITATLPASAKPILPGEGDSLGAWKILRRGAIQSRRSGGWIRYERELTIAAYQLGEVGPDTLTARGVLAGGDSLRLRYAPRRLSVKGKLAAGEPVDASGARDIRDVVSTGPTLWPWILLGAALIAAAIFFGWRRLRRRRMRSAAEAALPGPTPEEEFERAIERLLASGLLEQGLYREFYYRVSGAVRLYLERVHDLPLLESTSSEVLSLLRARIPGGVERDALREWLAEGDLVKYARLERLQAEARNYLERSLKLVRLLAAVGAAGAAAGIATGAEGGAPNGDQSGATGGSA